MRRLWELDRLVGETRTRLDQEGHQGGIAALGTELLKELGRITRPHVRDEPGASGGPGGLYRR
jgi:hypothetical protein